MGREGRSAVEAPAQRAWAPSPIGPAARRAFRVVWSHLVVEHPVEPPVAPADAIFCFGSRHHRVPERAAALHAAGGAPLVLVTGGPAGAGEAPESTTFARRLVELGVPVDRIVAEPLARHTGENVELGLAALRARTEVRRLLLVSWPLAARRTTATFAAQHPEVAVASTPALRRPGWRWCPTTKRIGLALGELDRLERYADLGWIAPVAVTASVADATAVLREELARLAAEGSAHDAPLRGVPAARTRSEPE